MYKSGSKLIFSGFRVEFIQYDGFSYFDNEARNQYRASTNVRRKINANLFQWPRPSPETGYCYPLFFTLTFKNEPDTPTEAHKLFRDFVKRWNYHIFGTKKAKLKYLNVPEYGEKNGRLHLHTLFFNVPRVKDLREKTDRLWTQGHPDNGWVWWNSVKHYYDLAGYLTKYIIKSFKDPRMFGQRRYNSSQGLIKPVVYSYDSLFGPDQDFIAMLDRVRSFQSVDFKYTVYDTSKSSFARLSSQKHFLEE